MNLQQLPNIIGTTTPLYVNAYNHLKDVTNRLNNEGVDAISGPYVDDLALLIGHLKACDINADLSVDLNGPSRSLTQHLLTQDEEGFTNFETFVKEVEDALSKKDLTVDLVVLYQNETDKVLSMQPQDGFTPGYFGNQRFQVDYIGWRVIKGWRVI